MQMNRAEDGNKFSVETSSSDASGYFSCVYSTAKMALPCCSKREDSVYITVYGKSLLIFSFHFPSHSRLKQIFILFIDFL